MKARATEIIKNLLGTDDADACIQEIKDRVRDDDTPHFRESLVREILDKYLLQQELTISEMVLFLPEIPEIADEFRRSVLDSLSRLAFEQVFPDFQIVETDEEAEE